MPNMFLHNEILSAPDVGTPLSLSPFSVCAVQTSNHASAHLKPLCRSHSPERPPNLQLSRVKGIVLLKSFLYCIYSLAQKVLTKVNVFFHMLFGFFAKLHRFENDFILVDR